MNLRRLSLYCMGIGVSLIAATSVKAATPSTDLLTPEAIAEIRSFIDQEIVRLSVLSQNEKYKNFSEKEVLALDEQWVKERKEASQPLISATLSNPLSSYLTRVQAHSYGLYTEIFVMDKFGMNVGQSNISSDYWQGDEAKFQKTYPNGGTAIFVDEPEYNDDNHSWHVQVNVSVSDGTNPDAIGAATIEVNLTELQRRQRAGNKAPAPVAAPEPELAPAPITVKEPDNITAPAVEAPSEPTPIAE